MLSNGSTAAQISVGVAANYANTTVVNLAKDILNDVLGTDLPSSDFNFQGALLGQVVQSSVYKRLFNALGLNENILDQAWKLYQDPILNLMNLQLPDGSIWNGPNQLAANINSGLHNLNGDLNFKLTALTFNTSTYELSAQIELDYDHNWGSFATIGKNIGAAIHNWAQTTVGHAQNWFKKEAGVLAQDWQNWNNAVSGALGSLDTPLNHWASNAIAALPQVLQTLVVPGTDVNAAVTNVVSNVGNQIENSKIGDSLSALAAGQNPLGLIDVGTFIDVNEL